VDNTDNLASTAFKELMEESSQNEFIIATNDHPMPLMRKGREIECYLCSQNNFMKNYPLQGKLDLLVEEEARPTPRVEESETLAEMVQEQKMMGKMKEFIETLVEHM
jgi:hypothetical protein